MAHAAPAQGTRANPDILGARAHQAANWAGPVVLGLVYGYWAAANRRSGGPITGWNLLFGFVTVIAFIALYIGVRALAPHMKREVHALLWTAFAGGAFGFLYSQTGASVLRAVGMSLAVSVAVFAVLFYRYYTHEDAQGHRL
ncbi:hypothetical protein ACFV0T_28490 [Streptomyces sp. NPDC059582]|uniref:hypothetical protein n=1 Tax=Streptomyces sp. NPDC059582 TaxID=3346875 RepID=UPI003692216C